MAATDLPVLFPLSGDDWKPYLGHCSRQHLYNLEARGELKLTRIGRRVFISSAEIARITETKA